MVQDRPFGPGFCFFCLHNRRRSCIGGGGGGAILSGIGLSGSDRDERYSCMSEIFNKDKAYCCCISAENLSKI